MSTQLEILKSKVTELHEYSSKLNIDNVSLNELSNICQKYQAIKWLFQEIENIRNIAIMAKERMEHVMTPMMTNITLLSKNYDDWGELTKQHNITKKMSLLMINAAEPPADLIKDKSKNTGQKTYKYVFAGKEIVLPIIETLSNIPPSIYYYMGDENYDKGVYMRISNNTIAAIPDKLDVITENSDIRQTTKCKNGKNCDMWHCTFQHPGGEYRKIGHKSRCASVPKFSNYDTFSKDISIVTYDDIRMCLLYSLSDIFCSSIWCQRSGNNNVILTDLQICDDYKNPYKG